MKFAKTLTASAVLSVLMLGNAAADADPARNLNKLFGNLWGPTTQPAVFSDYEVAVPRFTAIDVAPADGYPEQIRVNFLIFSAGTSTLKYITPAGTFNTPPIPAGCSPTDPNKPFDFDWNPHFARRDAGLTSAAALQAEGRRLHMTVNMDLDCWTGTTSEFVETSAVYSANTSGVAGPTNPIASWARVFPGKFGFGLNGVDTDGDLVTDTLMITNGYDIDPNGTQTNVDIYFLNPGTGAILHANTYGIVR